MINYPEFNKLALVRDIKDPTKQIIKELGSSSIVNLLDVVYTVPVNVEKVGNILPDYKYGVSWIYMENKSKFLVSADVFNKIGVPFISGETFTITATTATRVGTINILSTNIRTAIVSVKKITINVSPDPARPMLQDFYRMLMTNGSQLTVNSESWQRIYISANGETKPL